MDDNNLSEEEKRQKEEEITKRLQEIKNRLNKNKEEKKAEKPKTTEKDKEQKSPVSAASKKEENKSKAKAEEATITPKAEPPTPPVEKKDEKAPSSPPSKKPEEKEIEIKMAGQPTEENKNWSQNTLKDEQKNVVKNQESKKIDKVIKTKDNTKKKSTADNKSKPLFSRAKWIVAVLLITLTLGYSTWYLLSDHTSVEAKSESDTTVDAADVSENEDLPTDVDLENDVTASTESKGVENSPVDISEMDNIQRDNKKVSISEVDKPEKKVEPIKATPGVSKATLNLPCFVMSFLSTSDENKAKRKVEELRNKGLSAGYYWIPDYTAGGPQLYKVFVGPYPNRQSAHTDLERIRKYNKDAYYHIVE